MGKADQSVVGDLINFRGLVYAPLNENGVIFLFGKVAADLNMYVEEIKPGFPDCVARRFTGKGWEKVTVEFEFTSKNFQTHGHDPNECDLVVCWEHDWPKCPVEVIELKSEIANLPNQPIRRPDSQPTDQSAEKARKSMFRALKTPEAIQRICLDLEARLLRTGDGVWRKVAASSISFYSPERVFAEVKPQKKQVRVHLFTRGQPIQDVKPFGYKDQALKWGFLLIKKDADVSNAIVACKEALKRVQAARSVNEPTNWFASIGQSESTSTSSIPEEATEEDGS